MIKILVVDDSDTAAALITKIIESEPDMSVIGRAKNGMEAIEATKRLKPDLITMDIQMPVMDGLEATKHIVADCPTPIIVISSTISNESVQPIFHIMEAGALSALVKPMNILDPNFPRIQKHIANTIRAMSEIKVAKRRLKVPFASEISSASGFSAISTIKPLEKRKVNYEVLALGVSVGGPQALKTIFSKMPVTFPLPIVLVQHMSTGFIEGYAQWLNNNTDLVVKNASNMEKIKKGVVYIAPDNSHTVLERINNELHIKLVPGSPVDGFYPSISVLLQSVARVCGSRAIGGLLTGMGSDGAQGLLEMKKNHAHTFIQDKESAVVFGMAGVAQSLGAVDSVIKLENIATYLDTLTK